MIKSDSLQRTHHQYQVIAEKAQKGLAFFLLEPSGRRHYLYYHRGNGLLWSKYKNAVTLGEIIRTKPSRKPSDQCLLHTSKHILRVAEYLIQFELSDNPISA